MMFPKRPSPRRRKRHAGKSILQKEADRHRCWLCMKMCHDYSEHAKGILHKHHVYMGPNRDASEAEGFYVWLCQEHHEYGRDAVHRNRSVCRQLQKDMQEAFEKDHSRKEFMTLIGRSYIEDDNT